MPRTKRRSLSAYRRRLKRQSVVRPEVGIRKEDVPLVRGVVNALSDAERETEARALLRKRFGAAKSAGLKALLAAAPLEGIDLTRKREARRSPMFSIYSKQNRPVNTDPE
jgi:hypothetical protein